MASAPKLEKTRTRGVYKRGGRYVVTYRDGRRRQRKAFARTLTEAERLKKALETDVARGEHRQVSRVTFGEYAREWVVTYPGRTAAGIRDQTRADYEKRLEQDAIPLLGRLKLSELEVRDLDQLVERVKLGPVCRACHGEGCRACFHRGRIKGAIAANTVRLALAPVKAMLATAHQRGDIRFNPAAGYRARYEQTTDEAVDEHTEEVKALTPDQLVAFLGVLDTKDSWRRWRPFFEFLAQSGLRIGEAIEVRWKDIDLGKQTLRVSRRCYRGNVGKPKSKYGTRTLKLAPATAQTLWVRHATEKPDPDELVFTSEKGLRISSSNLMRRVLKPAAVTVGLGEWKRSASGTRLPESWVGFHTFRHTCATMLFRQGWNAVQVQRTLGHHKPSFTLDVYVHFLEDDLPETTFMDALVGNTGATSPPETPGETADTSRDEKPPISSGNSPSVSLRLAEAAAS